MNNRIRIQPSLYIGICVSLFLLPIPWLLAWFVAALVHEIGHLIALKILQVPIHQITVDIKGTYIETGYLTPHAELICALAGPCAGLICLLLFLRLFPLLAVCGFVQSAYNLLPYPNYDGGRILCVVLKKFLSMKTAQLVYRGILISASAVLIFFGLYFWLAAKLGLIAFIICVIPVIKSGTIKIPCKQR